MNKFLLSFCIIFCLLACKSIDEPSTEKDTLLFSFVTTGCMRLDKDDISINNPSTVNTFQLKRMFQDLEQLKLAPTYIFLLGDLVYGYTSDTTTYKNQLEEFKKLLKTNAQFSKSQLIVLPGNHESMPGKNLLSSETMEKIWVKSMQEFIHNNNGPRSNGLDGYLTDQQQLSWSFTQQNSTFFVLNSDPVGQEGTLPINWLKQELITEKVKQSKHIFLFSHKPAFAYNGEEGLTNSFGKRDSLWTILRNNRVKALFSAHNHLYWSYQPTKNDPWQIITGNGGSPLSSFIKSNQQWFFGFAHVKVYVSGKIIMIVYGHDIPSTGYFSDFSQFSTTKRDSIVIAL